MKVRQSCPFHKGKEVAFAVWRWVFRRWRCKHWEGHQKGPQPHLPAGGVAGGFPAPGQRSRRHFPWRPGARGVLALEGLARLTWNPHSVASGELGLLPVTSFLLALASWGVLLASVPERYFLRPRQCFSSKVTLTHVVFAFSRFIRGCDPAGGPVSGKEPSAAHTPWLFSLPV